MKPIRAALCALTLSIAAPANAAPDIHVASLEDGSELIVLCVPRLEEVSFRLVVHAGSSADPPQSEGIAHLLEHLVQRGGVAGGAEEPQRNARSRGAALRAFTAPEHTVYALVARRGALEAVLHPYLSGLTSPAILESEIPRALGVIAAEARYHRDHDLNALMLRVLTPRERGHPDLGVRTKRASIDRETLLAFHEAHYRPSRATFIFAGAIEPAEARRLVESATQFPPDDESAGERPASSAIAPPIDARLAAAVHAAIVGFSMDAADRPVCRELAELLDLRLKTALEIEQPIARTTAAACVAAGGVSFVVGAATGLSAGEALPADIEAVFHGMVTRAISGAERRHLEQRWSAGRARLERDPEALADAVIAELAPRGARSERAPTIRALFQPLKLDAGALRRAAEGTFVESRRIRIATTP